MEIKDGQQPELFEHRGLVSIVPVLQKVAGKLLRVGSKIIPNKGVDSTTESNDSDIYSKENT